MAYIYKTILRYCLNFDFTKMSIIRAYRKTLKSFLYPKDYYTWQLPTARNSGAANTAYPVEAGSIAFLSKPVKGVPLRGGCRLPLAQNLRAAILYYE